MDKPVSLPVKNWIIRNMSTKMGIAESVIEAVVNHQFSSAYDAMKTCESIEISGFGKFYFNRRKVPKKMEKMLRMKDALEKASANPDVSAQRRHSAALHLITLLKDIELLKPKMNENKCEPDLRGVAQSHITPEVPEENN